MIKFSKILTIGLCVALLASCASSGRGAATRAAGASPPDIVATNAFYYYRDVEAAWRFYADVLGFETVVDYGFAKILRIAETSYLTVVRASDGMHSVDEPKTVTLTLVTDELNRWSEHLRDKNVRILSEIVSDNHIVAIDPEGYTLKFLRYNPHPNHETYLPGFARATPVETGLKAPQGTLSVRAAAYSAYFENAAEVRPFYEQLFATPVAGQIDGVPAYQMSSSGYLLLVDGSDELHSATRKAGVTFSFLTTDVDAWYRRTTATAGFELRTPEIIEEGGGLVRVFVGYDPVGTFLEWDTFENVPENAALMRYLPQ